MADLNPRDHARNVLRERLDKVHGIRPTKSGRLPRKADQLGLEFLVGFVCGQEAGGKPITGPAFLAAVRGIKEFLDVPAQD